MHFGHSASDSRRLLLYFRKGPEGRFVMGGRGAYSAKGTEVQMPTLRKMSHSPHPQSQAVPWRFSWGGFVAMASVLGKVLADWASGTAPDALPFPVTPPQAIPFHFMTKPAVVARWHGPGCAMRWSRFRAAPDHNSPS